MGQSVDMSFHTDFEKWKEQSKKENCPVCNDEDMPEGMEDLYEAEYTWLNAEPVECIKGACHVTAKFHVIELYDLSDEQLMGFMKEVQIYAEALKKVTDAVKINYEIHGNTLPHFHLHLYPRYRDNTFTGQPIDYNDKSNKYEKGEFEEFVKDLRNEKKKKKK